MNKDDLLSRAITLSQLRDDEIYFVINHGYGAYLYLEFDTDKYNDRTAYAHEGSRDDDRRFEWTVKFLGNGLHSFQNFSSNSGGFLFRDSQHDKYGDYLIWGHNRTTIDNSKGDHYKFRLNYKGDNNMCHINTLDGYNLKADVNIKGGDRKVWAQPQADDSDRYLWLLVPIV